MALALLPQPLFALTKAEDTNRIPDLRPPLEVVPPTFWEQYGWSVVSFVLVALGLVAYVTWVLRRPKPALVIPPEIAARAALEGLRHRAEDEALVAEVSRHLRRYLLAAWTAQPNELTTDELLKALGRHPQLRPDLVTALGEFLRECDARKFAPVQPPAKPGLVSRALELVAQSESLQQPPPAPVPAPGPPQPTPAAS